MSKQQSLIIRGIAILLMLAYHLHDISDSYTSLIYIGGHPFTYYVNNMANPVCFFILLSGYGLSYTYGKYTFEEKIWKLLKLYTTYWIVLLLFPIGIGSFIAPELYPGTWYEIISNATGYRWSYNIHYWFLLSYAILFLSSEYIQKLVNKKWGDIIVVVVSLILYFVTSYIVSRYRTGFFRIQYIYVSLLTIKLLFPFVVGMVMERLNRQGRLLCQKLTPPIAIILLISIVVLRSIFHTHALNPFFAIIVIYLLIHVQFGIYTEKVLVELGKYSMPMWFIHGYFTIYLFQDYLCVLRYPLLIYLALVTVSYFLSIPIMKISSFLYTHKYGKRCL